MATRPSPPDPRARLKDYAAAPGALDLYRQARPRVAATWNAMADQLASLRDEAGVPVAELVARQIQELGLSFRMTGDADERAWPLTAMPLVIGAREWANLEAALVQRARLIEALTADIYGAQTLVADGSLPAALVAGSRFFARRVAGAHAARANSAGRRRADNFLTVYAADLVYAPGGTWCVVADRLRLANGIGYALENRLALSRSTGALLSDLNVRRLAQFFAEMRAGMARACPRESPRIALLTPGRLNQSYPEQAHLARYLGFPLVEGRDLAVSDDRLYVRTIAGPKRIDALWRWIDTNALDPLAFDARSEIGVPDAFEAWQRGGFELVNAPGAEALEAPAFAAYLPRLCERLLGETPLIACRQTWWCGDPAAAEQVRAQFDDLVLASAFARKVTGLPAGRGLVGASLSRLGRETLLAAMARRPFDYCAHVPVTPATTPALIDEAYVPRPFTLRVFAARGSDGEWMVMPGGFARLAASADAGAAWMGEGDLSADVCIIDDAAPARAAAARPTLTRFDESPRVRRGGGILASQAADNLYWFARYAERAEAVLRVIRAVLGSLIEVDAVAGGNPEAVARLMALLVEWNAITPTSARLPVSRAIHAALGETRLAGGVGTLFERTRSTGLALRDRLTPDFWRLVNRPLPPLETARPGALMRLTRELIERSSALSGLLAENFNRGPAWRFLDLGRRIERALGTCDMVAALGTADAPAEALGVLLDLSDSQITYRARYLVGPRRDPVRDLLLLDPDNPRSLMFQIATICDHIAALPNLDDDLMPEPPLLQARALMAPLAGISVETCGESLLAETEARLLGLSDTIAARYFLQFEKSRSASDSLLA